ncbi:adenylate/guanylate cyclase domain-containing protein [Pelagibius sp. Alg239-R121]|uniref:adenylate/guanylate cyclase domain-containing protein n=1 Tax=Pelagibius sp. Alg239-R121 TaxID=2993448 RepID=UPI0024A66429|nr:adenylate/guanylate cyclase domain-containing protein [Pelagibius sp. Alg239-R121]
MTRIPEKQVIAGASGSVSGTTDTALAETFREAEQAGLRIALKGRLVALVLLGAFLVLTRLADPGHALDLGLGIAVFAALGIFHFVLIGSRYDRPWLKYAFITVDIAILSLLMATQPVYDTIDVPQVMLFRNTIFPFYFLILGIAAFSFSPGKVLWSGVMVVVGWLGAFAWAIRDMPERLDWTDIGTTPTTEHFISVFLSPNFVGTGSRIQESLAYFLVAVLIAGVVWRARRTVRRQLELDEERRALTDVFGRYVPKAIADALINDRGLLEPVEGTATVLFIDVAGFTKMTEESGARRVVDVLNAFFDEATATINRYDGVVTQFIGDAIMATFNLPVKDPEHAAKAVRAALDIAALTENQTFNGERLAIRAGIATGPVIAGSVGGGGRQCYSLYGDTVNLSARLEELNKERGTRILIDTATVERLPGITLREMGQVAVRGFSESVAVFTTAAETETELRQGSGRPD